MVGRNGGDFMNDFWCILIEALLQLPNININVKLCPSVGQYLEVRRALIVNALHQVTDGTRDQLHNLGRGREQDTQRGHCGTESLWWLSINSRH